MDFCDRRAICSISGRQLCQQRRNLSHLNRLKPSPARWPRKGHRLWLVQSGLATFLKVLFVDPVEKKKVGMTSLAWRIAAHEAVATGASSVSEYIERVVLSQRFIAKDVKNLMERRRKRGGKQR
jgi:hypothetical protein